jgi:methionyl aminopeptidase
MLNLGGDEVLTLANGWTVVTGDRKASAHFELALALTESGPRILTLTSDGQMP